MVREVSHQGLLKPGISECLETSDMSAYRCLTSEPSSLAASAAEKPRPRERVAATRSVLLAKEPQRLALQNIFYVSKADITSRRAREVEEAVINLSRQEQGQDGPARSSLGETSGRCSLALKREALHRVLKV